MIFRSLQQFLVFNNASMKQPLIDAMKILIGCGVFVCMFDNQSVFTSAQLTQLLQGNTMPMQTAKHKHIRQMQ